MTKSPCVAKTPLQQQPDKREAKLIAHGKFLASAFSGPVPHPDILKGYEEICPGAADRIIKMAEKQLTHRQKLEKKVIGSKLKTEKAGMWLSFTLTFLLMVIGATLLLLGKTTAGYLSLFSPVIFHAGNYGYNKYREQRQLSSGNKDIEERKSKFQKKA